MLYKLIIFALISAYIGYLIPKLSLKLIEYKKKIKHIV